jgi:nucleoside-diphosphate-sugar epimerase
MAQVHSGASVLVAGGRGFIGRSVCALLEQKGYRVLSVDQANDHAPHFNSARSHRNLHCDLADSAQVRKLFATESVDGIIHLAAVLPTAAERDPLLATRVNIGGSVNLLEMARQFAVLRFVFASSLSIYGTHSLEECVSEEHRAYPEDLYGAAKLYIERVGEAYRQQHALDFVSLRIGRVVGPGTQSKSSAWRSEIFEYLGTQEPREVIVPFRPAGRLLLVHVDDVAKMLLTLLQAGRTKHAVYNACCESVCVADLKHELKRLNRNITLRGGTGNAAGNPQFLNATRFESEFGFRPAPIFEQLRRAAGKSNTS